MAQRLMIARALMHAPAVLFLDEPTNNLDPQSRLFLWDRIRALNAQGLTILLTTHDMSEADLLCGRIAIMDKGRLLVNDTPAELKKLIPGGNALELRVGLPPDTGAACLFEVLRGLPGVAKVDALEDEPGLATYRLYAEAAGSLVGPAAQAILLAGAQVRDLHVMRPSLEDVFIYLTGRQLR
jgi:ABC-2 type transport system ATP-binding protein